jgi:hypothetical protein
LTIELNPGIIESGQESSMKKIKSEFTYTAFGNGKLIVHGGLDDVVTKIKRWYDKYSNGTLLVFNDFTGKTMEFDLRGSEKEVLQKIEMFLPQEIVVVSARPGRPKLGVVTREVSLLPQHWEWLASQPEGASAALRKLVEGAKKNLVMKESVKQVQERAYKIMSILAGDLPQYEEALRSLYRRNEENFKQHIASWSPDIKDYVMKTVEPVFSEGT